MSQAPLAFQGRNPDVLTCIANLSNDEVFTPPEFANQMLNTVELAWAEANGGASIWADPNAKFLDPFTKSGVFLREITKRLVDGLADQIPDLQVRVDHILTTQVYGIGITELTALLARRSTYCSKWANGNHSIAKSFDAEAGNIWFQRVEHTWVGRRCRFCNAAEGEYGRGNALETHAYAFIHTSDIAATTADIFGGDVKFDVVIGNPPYQLGSDGGTRDVPIYQYFVDQAKKLDPRFLTMVIPSRWMAGGLGLADFRAEMLGDRRTRTLVDYPNSAEVFPSVDLKSGVCYFLWDAGYVGPCEVTTIRAGQINGPTSRPLDEFDVFVRDDRSLGILRKVLAFGGESVNAILARDKEFGWTSNFSGFHVAKGEGDLPLYYVRSSKRSVGYISRTEVLKSEHLIDTWKVLVPKAGPGNSGGHVIPDMVLGPSLIAPSPSVCTQSFLFFYVSSRAEAESVQSYYRTRFFRFLVSLRKITQDATHSTYRWVPQQTWDRAWTDAELYAKYGITDDEVAYIESMIRPMDSPDDSAD